MTAEEWKKQGTIRNVRGLDLFVVDTAKKKDSRRDTLVILHGFPTSTHDYHRVLPILSRRFRVILHDHPGFGFSAKPRDYSYSLIEQAEIPLLLWKQMGIKRAHLLAHDYGTSVTTEILARGRDFPLPLKLQSVTLANGSVHIELAKLRFLQKLLLMPYIRRVVARLTSQRAFRLQMKRLWHDVSLMRPEDLEAMWQMMLQDGGLRLMPELISYIPERYKYWHRWVGALRDLKIPAHVVWAQNDRVAVPAIGEAIAEDIPGSRITRLENLGHFPMLEDPERWAQAVLSFYR